jgi:hypothetical protein
MEPGVAAVAFVVLLFNKNIPPRLELEEIAISFVLRAWRFAR